MPTQPMTAIVLAGGRSRRLGHDKAAVRVAGRSLLAWVLDVLRQLTEDIVLVEAPERRRGWVDLDDVRRVVDSVPEQGPLEGLRAGLMAARSEYAWVVGCDMPFLHAGLLCHLASSVPGWDAAAPVWDGAPQPLCAVYSVGCLLAVARLQAEGGSGPRRLLEAVRTRWVSQEEVRELGVEREAFLGINTRAELEEARKLAGGRLPKPAE